MIGEPLGAAYFYGCNRGKRSVEADFETEEGQALVRKLAAHADVVIENFKLGGLKKYGLDYAALKAINPRIVYCSITGFGQTGPYAPRAGYDFLIQGNGRGDASHRHARRAAIEVRHRHRRYIHWPLRGQRHPGLVAATRGDRRRRLHRLRVTRHDGRRTGLSGAELLRRRRGAQTHMGNGHPNIVPYDVFPVADGDIIIATGNDGQYRKLCDVMGVTALADDERFRTVKDRATNRAVFNEVFHPITRRFKRADLLPKLDTAGVPAGPINTVADVFADPQILARGVRIDTPNALAKNGSTPGLRSPLVIDGAPTQSPRPAPALGEHTQDVLTDRNWGA